MKRWIAITVLIALAVFGAAWVGNALHEGEPAAVAAGGDETRAAETPAEGAERPTGADDDADADRPESPPDPVDDEPAAAPQAVPTPEADAEATEQRPDRPYPEPVPEDERRIESLGSDDPDSPFRLQADLTFWGAAVHQMFLSRERQTVDGATPYRIQKPVQVRGVRRLTFAARAVEIDGETVALDIAPWRLVGSRHDDNEHEATYQLTINSPRGRPMLRIDRRYVLRADRYHIDLEQRITNLTSRELNIRWRQHGPGDLDEEISYLGDQRRFTASHFDLDYDPNRRRIYNAAWPSRGAVIDGDEPDEHVDNDRYRTVWVASLNRYFAVVVFRPLREQVQQDQNPVRELDELFRVRADIVNGNPRADDQGVMLLMTTPEFTLGANASRDLDIEVYAGPRERSIFRTSPYAELEFDHLLRYELFGCMTWCTFQWLARGLLTFLRTIHSVTGDWAIAIIVLVLAVRLLLHPITKKSQITMSKMGKQMQALQPELKKLKEKYKDDPKQFQQEQMKLFREKGVNPLNMLGCLPLFLQMPIWIALWAMLYFAVELRHEPAFYGVFQAIGGGFGIDWHFLRDLSEPDMLVRLGDEPYFICGFPISPAINILPVLMAVFFFLQSKMMAPPAATPEQAQQQKMMRYMMLLFPIFLYSAPAGLTLYMLASAIGGMIDSYIVRRTVRRMEEEGTLFAKPKRKEGGFMDRIQKMAEQKQKEMAEKQKEVAAAKKAPTGSGGQGKKKKRKK